MPSATSVPPVYTTRQDLAHQRPSLFADLLFDGFFGGGIGGSAIAMYFLGADLFRGRPFYTPTVMGVTLFERVPAASVQAVQLDMVAYFSIVHFVALFGLAAAVGYLCRRSRLVGSHPMVVAAVVFCALTMAILTADALFMPGVIAALGYGSVLLANALTGFAMAAFIKWSHGAGRYGGDVTT